MLLKVILIISWTAWVSCTITGLSYMDPLNLKPKSSSSEDPCNPLYWYPRNIPEYCYFNKNTPKPDQSPIPVPLPIPMPQPFPIPMPMPIGPMPPMPPMIPLPPPFPMSPGFPMPAPPMLSPMPMPIYPQAIPLPYGIPLAPTNPMLPVAGVPYSNIFSPYISSRLRYQAGMVPGIPGMVTHDGGINVLPFSDAYADLLEKHKQKMIRKKIKRVLDDYEDYPDRREERRRRYRH